MCFTDVDLDGTNFRAYSKYFESPGSQKDRLCVQGQPWPCKVVGKATLGPIPPQIYSKD